MGRSGFLYRRGEKVTLSEQESKLTEKYQKAHTEKSHLEGQISEYLEIPIPEDWYQRQIYERRNYIQDYKRENKIDKKLNKRNKVCVLEIWCEMLKKELRDLTTHRINEIRTVLSNIAGWKKENALSQNRFGDGYGIQDTFYRLLENED